MIMNKAFTLVELLVVIAVIAVLVAILVPCLAKAREQAKVVVANAELAQIALALEMYMEAENGKCPPTRKDCSLGWEDHQIPPELVKGNYLPAPKPDSGMSAGIEDVFNRGNTYKYWSVGELYQNGMFIKGARAFLYIPEGFPDNEGASADDIKYKDPKKSPVTWVIYSQGPRFDAWETLKRLNGPVPERTWYDPKKRKGLVVRMRLKKGRQTETFNN